MPSSWTVFALSLSSLLPSSMIVERAFVCTCCDALRVRREKWCPLIRVSGFSNLRPPSWNGLCHFFGLSTPAQPQNKTNAYVKWWNDMKQIKYGQSVMMMMQWVGEWVSCDEMSEWESEWVSEWVVMKGVLVCRRSLSNFFLSLSLSLSLSHKWQKRGPPLLWQFFWIFSDFLFFACGAGPEVPRSKTKKPQHPGFPRGPPPWY